MSVVAINSVTIVIPVYRNRETIPDLCAQLDRLELPGVELDVVFVVDGCPDDSVGALRQAAPVMRHPSQIVELSRNFGAFPAIREGLAHATGDVVAVIAADLQEPPELVADFVRAFRDSGADVALGTRLARADPFLTRMSSAAFWSLYRRLVQPEMPAGGVDVFAVRARARRALLQMESRNTSLVGQLLWIGFDRVVVPYERRARPSGRSSWSLRKRLRYMSDSIFSFTDLPVRLMIVIGAIGALAIAIASAVVLAQWLLGNIGVPGYTPLMLGLLFVGFLLVMSLGVVGSYVWRTFENSKGRPPAIVREIHRVDRRE